jgi:hypothetical protein
MNTPRYIFEHHLFLHWLIRKDNIGFKTPVRSVSSIPHHPYLLHTHPPKPPQQINHLLFIFSEFISVEFLCYCWVFGFLFFVLVQNPFEGAAVAEFVYLGLIPIYQFFIHHPIPYNMGLHRRHYLPDEVLFVICRSFLSKYAYLNLVTSFNEFK